VCVPVLKCKQVFNSEFERCVKKVMLVPPCSHSAEAVIGALKDKEPDAAREVALRYMCFDRSVRVRTAAAKPPQ